MNYLLIQTISSSLQHCYKEWHLCRDLLTQSKLSNLFKFSFCLCCSNSMRQLQGEWKDIPFKEKNNYGFDNNIHSFKSICFQHWQWLSSDSYFLSELWQAVRASKRTAHSGNITNHRAPLHWKCKWQSSLKYLGISLGSFPQSHPILSPATEEAYTPGLLQAYQWDAKVLFALNPSVKPLILWIYCWLLSELNSSSQNKNLNECLAASLNISKSGCLGATLS